MAGRICSIVWAKRQNARNSAEPGRTYAYVAPLLPPHEPWPPSKPPHRHRLTVLGLCTFTCTRLRSGRCTPTTPTQRHDSHAPDPRAWLSFH